MKKILAIILTLFIVPEVLALDMEYYAPNGLPTVSEAFQRMALIFSDGEYFSAYGIFVMIGMFLAIANNYIVKPSSGGAASNYSWIAPAIIGTVLVFGLIVPKGAINIYDPVKNQTINVPDIPDGVVLIAGLFNLLERKMIDITDTASAYPYSKNAGGVNFKMFLNAIQEGKNNKKYFLQKDVKEYYSKCGKLSMAITGTNIQDFRSGITSPYAILSEWVHPSVWVNMYDGDRTLDNMTCTAAWNNVLRDALVDTNFIGEVESACTTGGFNITNIAERQRCFEIIGQANKLHDVASTSATNFIREAFINETIIKKMNEDEPEAAQRALLGRQITLQGLGALNAAEDTQVTNKAVMTAIILGLIPLLSLFFVTPLWLKALKFIVGAMLWLTTWGITMAVAHAGVMDAAIAVTDELVRHKMGLDAFMFAETDAIKALMLFGKMQSNSIMMATAVAIAVYGFGSYAMVGLAQGMAQSMQNTGEQASSQTTTSEGRAGMRQGLSKSMADSGAVQGSSGPAESMTNEGWGSYAGVSAMDAYTAGTNQGTGDNLRDSKGGAGVQAEQTAAATAGSIAGVNAGHSEVAKFNGVDVLEQTRNTAETQTIASQTGAAAAEITQENLGEGSQVMGAKKIADSNQGQIEANVAKMNLVNPGQSERDNAFEQSMAQGADSSMTGAEILEDKDIGSRLNASSRKWMQDNPDFEHSVHKRFDGNGNVMGFKIGQSESVEIDNHHREDRSETKDKSVIDKADNIKSNVSSISTNMSYDDAAMKGLMQNTTNDPNFRSFESRFNQAKGDIGDPTDDQKGVRDNIINDIMYGFKDVEAGELSLDEIRKSNDTSGRVGTPGEGILGSSASNTTSVNLSTTEQEQAKIDATRGQIANIYEQSDNAEQFLSEVNNFHGTQYEKMLEMSKSGDLYKDNKTTKDKDDEVGGA